MVSKSENSSRVAVHRLLAQRVRTMTTCSSPRLSHRSAYVIDQTILAAREESEDAPLPSAFSLLMLFEPKPMPHVGAAVDELPLMELAPTTAVDLLASGSPDLRHSRLAQRWFKSVAKREGSLLGETPSMIDLTRLCCGVDDDGALSSPTSIVESFDVLLDHAHSLNSLTL